MNAQQIAQKVVKAIEDQDWQAAQALLADDYTFSGAVPQPIGGPEWLGVHRALAKAMPDLRFNFVPGKTEGNTVEGAIQITGTHTGEFSLPMPGLPQVPATGKKITNAIEPVRVTARGDKLINWEVTPVPDGGLLGILSRMGATVPAH